MRPWETTTSRDDLLVDCACARQQVPDDVTAGYGYTTLSQHSIAEGETIEVMQLS